MFDYSSLFDSQLSYEVFPQRWGPTSDPQFMETTMYVCEILTNTSTCWFMVYRYTSIPCFWMLHYGSLITLTCTIRKESYNIKPSHQILQIHVYVYILYIHIYIYCTYTCIYIYMTTYSMLHINPAQTTGIPCFDEKKTPVVVQGEDQGQRGQSLFASREVGDLLPTCADDDWGTQ